MTVAIERKFLVQSEQFKKKAIHHYKIVQGFLNKDPKRTVRIRLKGNTGYLTVKGISSADGLSRFEWEKEILPAEGKELLSLCDDNLIGQAKASHL